jgi:hypothetical protein
VVLSTFDRAHEGLVRVPVEPLDLETDGLEGVEWRWGGGRRAAVAVVDLGEDAAVSEIDDGEVLVAGPAQRHALRRDRNSAIQLEAAAGLVDQPVLAEITQDLARRLARTSGP